MAVCCSTRKELTCVLLNRILHFRKTSTKGGSLKQKTITRRVHSEQAKQQTHVRINFNSSNDEQHTKWLILKLAIGILFQCYKISNHLKRKINSKALDPALSQWDACHCIVLWIVVYLWIGLNFNGHRCYYLLVKIYQLLRMCRWIGEYTKCVLNIRSMTMVGINWSLVVIVACGYICLHLKNQLSKICISDCQKHMKHWINWLIVNRFEPVPFPVASSTLLWWEVVMVMLVVVAVAVGGVDASNEIEWCIAKCLHFR